MRHDAVAGWSQAAGDAIPTRSMLQPAATELHPCQMVGVFRIRTVAANRILEEGDCLGDWCVRMHRNSKLAFGERHLALDLLAAGC